MKDRPIRPTWTKGVYPLLSGLQEAIDAGNLYVAMESRIIGAVIVTDKEDEAYRQVDWAVNTDRVAVIHLLAADPDRHGTGIGHCLLEKARDVATGREMRM